MYTLQCLVQMLYKRCVYSFFIISFYYTPMFSREALWVCTVCVNSAVSIKLPCLDPRGVLPPGLSGEAGGGCGVCAESNHLVPATPAARGGQRPCVSGTCLSLQGCPFCWKGSHYPVPSRDRGGTAVHFVTLYYLNKDAPNITISIRVLERNTIVSTD